MQTNSRDIIIADIPGIIEGASHGAGMGFKFLKHISRTKALIFLIDLSSDDFREVFNVLYKELEEFAPDLVKRTRLIIGTKTDLEGTEENLKELRSALPKEKVLGMRFLVLMLD